VAISAWVAGGALGGATANNLLTLTTVPGCDSIILAFIVYFAGKRLQARLRACCV